MSRLLETFLDLVAIDSPSFDEKDVADYIRERAAVLGMAVTADGSSGATGSNTGNLICSLPGDETKSHLLVAAHMDTVEPGRGVTAIVEGDVITSDGQTVLGADDKVGIAVSIELVERIVAEGMAHGRLTMLFTVAEEKGLVGAKNLDWSLLPRPDYAFVLDAEGLPGEVIIEAPYYDSVTAVFHGKAAHAGAEPEAGANAIKAAADGISRARIGRIDHETTVNIGTIHGGRERNIVPDRVEVTGEVRSLDQDKLAAQVRELKDSLGSVEGDGITVEFTTKREFEGYKIAREHPAAMLVADGLMAAGLTPHFRHAGGGSDANVFNAMGVDAVALSVGYTGAHARQERVHLSDMEKSVGYLVETVRIAGARTRGGGR